MKRLDKSVLRAVWSCYFSIFNRGGGIVLLQTFQDYFISLSKVFLHDVLATTFDHRSSCFAMVFFIHDAVFCKRQVVCTYPFISNFGSENIGVLIARAPQCHDRYIYWSGGHALGWFHCSSDSTRVVGTLASLSIISVLFKYLSTLDTKWFVLFWSKHPIQSVDMLVG